MWQCQSQSALTLQHSFGVYREKYKMRDEETGKVWKVWWFCKQTALKWLYLVCALLTTVSAGYMLKKSEVQRKDVRSVSPFFTLPTQHWTYLPYSSFRHTTWAMLRSILQIWQNFTYAHCQAAILLWRYKKPTWGKTWVCGRGEDKARIAHTPLWLAA